MPEQGYDSSQFKTNIKTYVAKCIIHKAEKHLM